MEEQTILDAYELAVQALEKAEKLEEEEQRKAELEYERWVRDDTSE